MAVSRGDLRRLSGLPVHKITVILILTELGLAYTLLARLTDIISRTVSELSQLTVQIPDTLHF